MLSLLLVVGICSDNICSYMDVTQRMQVASDESCYVVALESNRQNLEMGLDTRYDCMDQSRYLTLIGEEQKPAPRVPGPVL